MAFNDWNGDGKKDIYDDMIEHQIYKDTMGENDEDSSSGNRNFPIFNSNNSDNRKLQTGYNIVLICALLFIGITFPILTVAFLIVDPEYFFEDANGAAIGIIGSIEIIVLIVLLIKKLIKNFRTREKNEFDKSEKHGAVLIVLILSVGFIAAFISTQTYKVQHAETTTITTTEPTTIAVNNYADETTSTPAVPYIGMSESRIDSTSLGTAKRRGHINNEMINGQVYPAYLYDYYRGDTLVFTARCVQGRVYNVWDYRNTTTTKYHYTTKRHTTKKYDEYDVYDYSNEEDFYYDHYDDFYDYYEAEDYYNEHHD